MTKFIMSTIFQSFRNLLFDFILHVSEDSSSVLMAEQAEIGNVWLYLKLRWILLWKLSQIWTEKRCQTNNWKYFMSSKFWLCATDSFLVWHLLSFKNLCKLKFYLLMASYNVRLIYLSSVFLVIQNLVRGLVQGISNVLF